MVYKIAQSHYGVVESMVGRRLRKDVSISKN